MAFPEHLASFDVEALTALLASRPDLLVEPVPRDVDELAQRLGGTESLSVALPVLDRDETVVARTVALLGAADVATVAHRVAAPTELVAAAVDRLCARGLAWRDGPEACLPLRLAAHFAGAVEGFRPVRTIGGQVRVEQLRETVTALGGDPSGTKTALIEALERCYADPAVIVRAVEGLSRAAGEHLRLLLGGHHQFGYGGGPPVELLRAGLLLGGSYGAAELPREVAVPLLIRGTVTGRPEVAASTDRADDGRAGAESALLALVTVLDDARVRPIAALKKGGVGARERARLTKSLRVTEPALWIDVTHAAGLLAPTGTGYTATAAYDGWRDQDPGSRWAGVAAAWFELHVAPTSREYHDGEVAPPLHMSTGAGILRRALLRAGAGGGSLRSAAEHVEWFCPMHQDHEFRAKEVDAALREGAALGVVAGDRLTALGELLVTGADDLAARAAALLPETRGGVVLQSDLTAVVSGQPSAAAARLLAACAQAESRGAAATWRFTPQSVRAAMDDGWAADALRAELVDVSGRELPQPLDYLISDVARRHGTVRVREVRAVVTGSESDVAEIAHTRSLRSLQLVAVTPTVLTSPSEPAAVVKGLRGAGFSPMPEDADGTVIVTSRESGPPPAARRRAARARVAAPDLAARLLAGRPE